MAHVNVELNIIPVPDPNQYNSTSRNSNRTTVGWQTLMSLEVQRAGKPLLRPGRTVSVEWKNDTIDWGALDREIDLFLKEYTDALQDRPGMKGCRLVVPVAREVDTYYYDDERDRWCRHRWDIQLDDGSGMKPFSLKASVTHGTTTTPIDYHFKISCKFPMPGP